MDIMMLPAVLADFLGDNKQMISAVLWIAAGVILVLLIMRRRKRKLQG
jgi:hypothetical protein